MLVAISFINEKVRRSIGQHNLFWLQYAEELHIYCTEYNSERTNEGTSNNRTKHWTSKVLSKQWTPTEALSCSEFINNRLSGQKAYTLLQWETNPPPWHYIRKTNTSWMVALPTADYRRCSYDSLAQDGPQSPQFRG